MLAFILQSEDVVNEAADSDSYEAILWFGGVVIGGLLLTQLIRSWKGKPFSITFARLTGLVFIATVGVALALAEVANEAQTAAFTLLGTIAGYLAGARPTTPSAGGDGGGPGDGGGGGRESVL